MNQTQITNPFAGISQGLQNFMNTQLAIYKMKRQEAQDAMSLKKFQHEMELNKYQIEKLEKQKREEQALEKIHKETPLEKTVYRKENGDGKEYTEEQVLDPEHEGEIFEEKTRPTTLAEQHDYQIKRLQEEGHYSLAMQKREQKDAALLRALDRELKIKDAFRSTYETAKKLHGFGLTEQAQNMVVNFAKQVGIDIKKDQVLFKRDHIEIKNVNGYNYSIIGDKIERIPDKNYSVYDILKEKHTKNGVTDWNAVVKDIKNLKTIENRGSGQLTEKEIAQEIAAEKQAIMLEIQHLDKLLAGYSPQNLSTLDKLLNRKLKFGKNVGTSKEEIITDEKETQRLHDLFEKRKKLVEDLKNVPENVRNRITGRIPKEQEKFSKNVKDNKGNPVEYGKPYKFIEHGTGKEIIKVLNPRTDKWEKVSK